MTTQATPAEKIREQVTTCPITGLEIRSRSDWTDLPVGSDYTITFKIIGKKILYSAPSGDVSTVDMPALIAHRERVLVEHYGTPPPVVEIRNYAEVSGKVSRETRTAQTQFLLDQKDQFLAFVSITPSWAMKKLYQLGTHFNPPPMPFEIVSDYESGLKKAVYWVQATSSQGSLQNTSWLENQSWNYRGLGFSIVHKVLLGNIVVAIPVGEMEHFHVKGAAAAYERIFSDNGITSKVIHRISDYSGLQNLPISVMNALRKEVSGIHERYGIKLRGGCVFGVDWKTRVVARLFSRFFKGYRMEIARDWETALRKVTDMGGPQNTGQSVFGTSDRVPIDSGLIDNLVSVIGSLTWENRSGEIPSVAVDHPLKEVYEAIRVVKGDIEQLQEKEQTLVSELHQCQEQLQLGLDERQELEQSLLAIRNEAVRLGSGSNHLLIARGPGLRVSSDEIVAMASLLLDTDLNSEQRDYARSVMDTSENLRTDMDEILGYRIAH